MKEKKIILLTTDLVQGGVSESSYKFIRIFQEITNGYKSKKFQLYVISYEPIKNISRIEKYRKSNIHFFSLNSILWKNFGRNSIEKTYRSIARIWNLPRAFFKFCFLIKSLKPQVVISFGFIPNIINIFGHLTFKYQAICVDRSYPYLDLQESTFKRSILRFLEFAYRNWGNKVKFIAISKPLFFWYKKQLKLNMVYYIPNAIDIEEIERKSIEPLEPKENEIFKYPVLINVGRLTKQKGQWYLIRIFKALKNKFPNLKLVILGDGELKNYLVQLSKKLGLKTYVWSKDNLSPNFDVYFLGFKKNPFKYIAKSEVFIFPSLWEGFPNALIEAMACKVPVISSDCKSGPREILAPKTNVFFQTSKPEFAEYGILMPTFNLELKTEKDPLSFKEKLWVEFISDFITNRNLAKKYAAKAYERAKQFDIKQVAKLWRDIIDDKYYNEHK